MTEFLSTGRQSAMDSTKKSGLLTSAVFKISNPSITTTFSELAGINSEVEQAEYMEVGAKGSEFGRFFGKSKPPTITLKRAMSAGEESMKVWSWHAQARAGLATAYMDTTFELFAAGKDPSSDSADLSYTLVNAFPTKVEVAGMKAGATEVILQTVTLQCDEIISAPKS